MKLLLIIPLLSLFFIPAYAETIPQSLHGYETSGGGKYSQIWLEWDDMNLVNATITLPDRKWNEIIIPLSIDKYSSNDGIMSIFSQIDKYTQLMLTGEYLDDNTMLINGRLSTESGIMPLQYIANVTSKELETPSQQITILGNFADVVFFEENDYEIHLRTVDANNHLVKIGGVEISYTVTRDGVIFSSGDGHTSRYGEFSTDFSINSSRFLSNACYELNITASKDEQVTEITEDFRVMTYSTTYGQNIDRDESSLLIPSDYNCNR